ASALPRIEVLDVERERVRDPPPPHRARTRGVGDVAPRGEERDPRTAHEPLQRPADQVVDTARVDVERERADRLIRVHDERSTSPMTELGERLHVLDPAA